MKSDDFKLNFARLIFGGLCFGLALLIQPASLALCAETYKPALRTLGIWIQEPRLRLDINLWYPSFRAPRELNYAPWIVNAAPNAPPAEGRFPLIVISHDSAGSRFSYHDTAAWLAAQGYIVAAPTHAADSQDNMDSLFTSRQLQERLDDIEATIELLLQDREIGPHLDDDAIGLAGYGAGAAACLLLGGAEPDCAAWAQWCEGESRTSYCAPHVREKIDNMCATLQMQKIKKISRIKAIAALSPAYGMLFGSKSFTNDFPPVLIVAAARENFNNPELHSERIGRLLGAKAHYLELPAADAGALLAACPPAMAQELPELCLSADEKERNKIHREVNNALKMFFGEFLK